MKKTISVIIIYCLLFSSCEENINNDLQGSWLYQTNLNECKKLHDGDSLIQYFWSTQNYLTFSGNTITSTESELLIIEKGTFKIVGDSLVTLIGDWEERSHIELTGDSLILTRIIDGIPSDFKYFRSEPYKMDTAYRSLMGDNYFNPAVYTGFDWVFTGKSYYKDNDVKTPIDNNLPKFFSLKLNQQEHFSFNNCLFDYKDENSDFSAYIHKYDGTEMHISSARWSGSFDLLSNTVYVYKRER